MSSVNSMIYLAVFNAVILFSSPNSHAQPAGPTLGGMNGGGGYTIVCDDGKTYALDFKATERAVSDIAPVLEQSPSGIEILQKILEQLKEKKMEELAESLEDFMRFNQDEYDLTTARRWIDSIHPLMLFGDEQRIRAPENCLRANQTPNIYQAIIRERADRSLIYHRDVRQMQRLEENSPIQTSFTLLHEWLRDYTENPAALMRTNRFLHSKDFFEKSRTDNVFALIRMGLENLPVSIRNSSVSTIPVTPGSVVTIGIPQYIGEDATSAIDWLEEFDKWIIGRSIGDHEVKLELCLRNALLGQMAACIDLWEFTAKEERRVRGFSGGEEVRLGSIQDSRENPRVRVTRQGMILYTMSAPELLGALMEMERSLNERDLVPSLRVKVTSTRPLVGNLRNYISSSPGSEGVWDLREWLEESSRLSPQTTRALNPANYDGRDFISRHRNRLIRIRTGGVVVSSLHCLEPEPLAARNRNQRRPATCRGTEFLFDVRMSPRQILEGSW